MCLIFISIQQHPDYRLIIAANRDEFYNRQTAAADFWKDNPMILGGRDLQANGTWLGVTRSGRISLLTNYRDPANINANAPSRGRLVSDYLGSKADPEEYLSEILKKGKQYNGFNLLVGSADGMWYYSNYSEGIKKLSPGLHGLSNHLLDTPWPKVKHGKELLKPLLEKPQVVTADLFRFLFNEKRAQDSDLPDTGVGIERERALSSMFIKSPGYGSRCSTIVTVDKDNNLFFAERVFNTDTFAFTEKQFAFKIESTF
jgi:uncharacterized protein with NRDE domain